MRKRLSHWRCAQTTAASKQHEGQQESQTKRAGDRPPSAGEHLLRRGMLAAFLCGVMLCVLLTACGQTELKTVEQLPVSIPVSSEPISAAALVDELSDVAKRHLPGAMLVEIQALFVGKQQVVTQTGQLVYTYTVAAPSFRSPNEPQQLLLLHYDMASKQVVAILRKERVSHANDTLPQPVDLQVAQVLFSSLLSQIQQEEAFEKQLSGQHPNLSIVYTADQISIEVK